MGRTDPKLLKTAVESMGECVLITGPDIEAPGPEIVYANRAFLDMTGYRLKELIGQSPRLFRGPQTDANVLKQLKKCLRGGREFEGELLNYRKDGTSYWTNLRINPVRNRAGDITHWVSLQRDVSDEREWASEMQRINAVLSAQMELSPDGILVVDVNDRVIAYNGRFQRMWGIPLEAFARGRQEDILGFILEKVTNPDAYRIGMEAFYRSGEKRLEDEVTLCDGRIFERYCVTTHSPQGKFYGWLWYFTDVTQQREFENRLAEARQEAEAASLAKSQFLANMSHEIRTPLNGIIGMTEILLQTSVDNEQRDFLSTIQASGDNLLILINDLLDLSRIESGRLELDETEFDLFSMVEDALAVVGARVGTKNLDIGYLIDPALPERFRSDENRLRQILINLLGNAVKFTEAGEVVLEVKPRQPQLLATGRPVPEILTLEFTVRDTGIGISSEDQVKLFQPFSQVDPSTTRRYGGSGLGLSICRRLVDLLDGEIWLESRVGGGSTFSFTVPLRVGSPAPGRSSAYLSLKGARLLVVDDNATNRLMVRHQTVRHGIEVDEAKNGRQALEKWKSGQRYDLVLLDMQMPEMDGLTLAGKIRALPGGERQPILLSTSLGRYGGIKQEATRLGLHFLCKPFRQFQLISLLKEIVGGAEVIDGGESTEKAAESGGFDPQLSILLAEDNPVNRKVALGLLNRLGIQAESAVDGREAVRSWERGRHDLIFMDVHMPEMDGLAATREIRRLSGNHDLPWIVAMTADALAEDRAKCIEAGMNDYLSKPVKSIDLVSVLRRVPQGEGKGSSESGDQERRDPEGGAGAEAPGFSEETLSQLAALGESDGDHFLRELVEVFLDDVPDQLEGMRKALSDRDAAALARAAHSVKGASSNFGAAELQAKCFELETRAREGTLEGAENLIGEIEMIFKRLAEALRSRFS